MRATPYSDVNALLDGLLSRVREALGEKLAGLYLYGSLAAGDFDAENSDIDLLAAVASDIEPEEFQSLLAMHRELARENRQWDDRIEVAYLSVKGLRTFRTERSAMAVISPGEPFHMVRAGREWLMNWYIVREEGVALLGPPAAELIAPISREEFAECVQGYAEEVAGREARTRKEQAYAILTMCRALHLHRTGERASKRRAALWAQGELPQWSSLIERALAWREAWPEEDVDQEATQVETVQFVECVVGLMRS